MTAKPTNSLTIFEAYKPGFMSNPNSVNPKYVFVALSAVRTALWVLADLAAAPTEICQMV